MGSNKSSMLLLAIVVFGVVSGICSAKTVVVGGNAGWSIPTTSASFYSNWVSQQKLQVGDVLVFNFPAGIHTVAEVSKANYDSCTSSNKVGPLMTTAPANITLTNPGTHYFICTVSGHCLAGQKLAVTATSSAPATPAPKSSPPPMKSPSPSPSPSPSMRTSPVTAPTPAPTPSASRSPVMAPTPAPAPAPATATTPSSSPSPSVPLSPVASGPGISSTPMGQRPAAASGPESGPGSVPPPSNFAASTGVSIFSLLSVIAAGLALLN